MFRLTSLAFVYFTTLVGGCKKEPDEMPEFSFTYNGQTYTGLDYGSTIEVGREIIGVEIRKPDVLGGTVHFTWTNNCAYIEPPGMIIYDITSCRFDSSIRIDSSLIYSYQSGGKQNYTETNCKTGTSIVTGTPITSCTISCDFSLVLVNNAGLTKTITGTFKRPNMAR